MIDRDPELKGMAIGLVANAPHVAARQVFRALRAHFDDGRALPSEATVKRWLRTWRTEDPARFARLANPDAARGRFAPAGGRADQGVVRLNQVWEMDSTRADVVLADGRRHVIVQAIDVFSRRMKLLVTPTSRAVGLTTLLRRAILDWGVPETVKTDQGQDYVSHHFTGALAALQVTWSPCPPFTPQGKPFVERGFRTFSHDLLEILPGFTGHDVAEAQAIRSRASFADRLMRPGETVTAGMSAEELQAFCDDWCAGIYEHQAHGGLDGRTPFQAAAGWTGAVRRIENERALDILLSEAPDNRGWRVVGKRGLSVEGFSYDAPALGGLIGRRVRVRLDAGDLGRVWVFDEAGQFVCEALAPEVSGIERAALAAKKRQVWNEYRQAADAEVKAAKRATKPADVAQRIIDDGRRRNNVTALPRRGQAHETPELAAAAAAARGPVEVSGELTAEQRERAEAEWRRIEGGTDNVVQLAPPTAPDGRPRFRTDPEMALWLIAHLDRADGYDREWLAGKIADWSFRQLIDLDDAAAIELRRTLQRLKEA